MIKKMIVALAGSAAVLLPGQASAASCDRACMRAVGATLVASIEAHKPAMLPMAPEYAAAQNNVPQAIPMMNIWRTVAKVKEPFFAIDVQTRQMFLVATFAEGVADSMFYGRVHLDEAGRIDEAELFIDRSRGDAGFQYGLRHGKADFPHPAWTAPTSNGKLAGRDELSAVGRTIFDQTLKSPPIAEGCVMMENGEISNEDPEVLKYLMPSDVAGAKLQKNARGNAIVPCAAPPERPTDKKNRVVVVDEEQGIVIAMAMMDGKFAPYLVENPSTSAFVPNDILEPYEVVLREQAKTGKFNQPRIKNMDVTAQVTEMYRYYDGKIQAMHLLFNMEPKGATSPWVK